MKVYSVTISFILAFFSLVVCANAITLDFELGYTDVGTYANAVGAEAEFNHIDDQAHVSSRSLQDTREYGGLIWQGSADNYGHSSVNWLGETPETNSASWLITQSEARANYLYGGFNDKTGNEFAVGGSYTYLNAASANGGEFILDGAWFSGIRASSTNYSISDAWLSASTISIEGFNSGLSTGSLTLDLDIDSWLWFDTRSLGIIDSFTIITGQPVTTTDWATLGGDEAAFYRFDDLSYAPVPEPSTILLLGGGLAGLAFYRRKRK